jgi:hypothetical protein
MNGLSISDNLASKLNVSLREGITIKLMAKSKWLLLKIIKAPPQNKLQQSVEDPLISQIIGVLFWLKRMSRRCRILNELFYLAIPSRVALTLIL